MHDLFLGLGGLLVFEIADGVDHSTEGRHDMIEIEDNLHVRVVFLESLDVGIPHVHRNRLQPLALFLGREAEEFRERLAGSVLFHPEHPARFVIENDRHSVHS